MNKISWILLAGVLLGYSCSQRVRIHISQPVAQSGPIAASSVQVLSHNDSVPNEAVWIGSLKVGDNGFSKTGNLDTTLRLAREEAAKAGGKTYDLEHRESLNAINLIIGIVFGR